MVTTAHMPSHADIVRDMLARVRRAEKVAGRQLDDQLAQQVEREIRQHWGGEQVHVPRRQTRDARAERNSRIQRAYLANVRLAEIARQEQITERQVLRVVRAR
jgi:Mor family transcriptional regulator